MKTTKIPAWEQFAWLRHGFTGREGGASTVYGGNDLNLGFTCGDDALRVRENRQRLLGEVMQGVPGAELACVRQVHGTQVQTIARREDVKGERNGQAMIEADGMMAGLPGLLLGIQVADCVPVLVVDTRRRIVAAFHAGWRGTAGRIVEQGIAQMQAEFGSVPEDLMAAVGPSIRACCYGVGAEVESAFRSTFAYSGVLFSEVEGGTHLDLAAANRRQLLDAGLPGGNVAVVDECTACARMGERRKYFSHRKERGLTGRSMGVIGMVE